MDRHNADSSPNGTANGIANGSANGSAVGTEATREDPRERRGMFSRDPGPRQHIRSPLASPEAIAAGPAPFPRTTPEAPLESAFADWRQRLERNLSRRSDGRWEPLTRTHAEER